MGTLHAVAEQAPKATAGDPAATQPNPASVTQPVSGLHFSDDISTCALCEGPCDSIEDWCWGCRHFVCEECTGEVTYMGDHRLEDHEAVQ